MTKKLNFLIVFSFVLLLAGSFLFNGCESSRVGPEVTVNVPTPPAAALVLQGSVYNSKTGLGVANATVGIYKLDGTTISSVATAGDGSFVYDVSSLTNTSYKITANANGFGTSFKNANVNPTTRTADIISLPLDPLVSVAVNLTAAGGTTTPNTQNTESKSGASVVLTVPANAVTTNTTVSVSTPSVNNVPPPANASTTAQVGVTNLTPAGITFLKPVDLSYPLPYEFPVGSQIPVMQLVNGTWQTSSLNATVDNTGYTAKLSLTQTGQYALLDNTAITGNTSSSIQNSENSNDYPPMLKATKTLFTTPFTLTGGSIFPVLQTNTTVTSTVTNVILTPPTWIWVVNNFFQRYGYFTLPVFNTTINTSTNNNAYNETYSITWPGVPINLRTTSDGHVIDGNGEFPTDTGSWSLLVVYETYTTTSFSFTMVNASWSIALTQSITRWREQAGSRQWKWTGHNQGKVYSGY